jgi:hypothetical protein
MRNVMVYQRVKQMKYKVSGLQGLLVLHDNGRLAASMDHQSLFDGLGAVPDSTSSYITIKKPSASVTAEVFRRMVG